MIELSIEADGSCRTISSKRKFRVGPWNMVFIFVVCRRTGLALGFLWKSFNYVGKLHQTLGRFNLKYYGSGSPCTCHMGPELVIGKVHPYLGLGSSVGLYGQSI